MQRLSARQSADPRCALFRRSPPNSWRIQALHRIRQRLVRSRTKLVNQIRGILAEHGIVIARDIWRLRRALAEITGHATDDLNTLVRVLIMEAQAELMELDRRIASCDRRIRELYRTSELCQRLGEIAGIGPVTATALVAAVGDRSCFKNGRQVRCMAGACTEAAVKWRTTPIVRH